LEKLLAEAHAKSERAQAMAEKTKSGFVYVISNIGSFGDDVVKIGLTRRLDPSDRVRELGDASVPFLFDTHAMIYSEEAPALEAALHAEFAEQRINAANMRKEFFRVTRLWRRERNSPNVSLRMTRENCLLRFSSPTQPNLPSAKTGHSRGSPPNQPFAATAKVEIIGLQVPSSRQAVRHGET